MMLKKETPAQNQAEMPTKPTTNTQTRKDIRFPGGPPTSKLEAISHAVKITKHGFRNSEGCTDANPKEYQRTAPLP